MRILPVLTTTVITGGLSVLVTNGPVQGGYIFNPLSAIDQGISTAEILYIDITGPATTKETATTVPINPGEYFQIPSNSLLGVWVNSISNGHKFTAFIYQPEAQYPPTPIKGDFPPLGPTGLTKTIPSYLYEEYFDDDDLQAFIKAQNELQQVYVDTFNDLQLPIYTREIISGLLLDWVGNGLYGCPRPSLSAKPIGYIGPYNTYQYNTFQYNQIKKNLGKQKVISTDDIYKRVLTWHFWKGDGKYFTVKWLKRRIMRFLIGENGTAPNIDNTDQISISFGIPPEVSIRIVLVKRTLVGGALYNRMQYNQMRYNQVNTIAVNFSPLPNVIVLKEAIDAGVLELPFQFTYIVTIG